jgi:tetratricopeptide (TPR) repeat protein
VKSGFLLLACWLSTTLAADTSIYQPSSQALALESAKGSARSQALGLADVAMTHGADSIFSNPASLAVLKEGELSVHHNSWLVDTWQETGLVALPMGRWGGAALFGDHMDYGSFEGRDPAGNLTASFSASRNGGGVGWGWDVAPGLAVGAAVKATLQQLADDTSQGFSGDIGALYHATPLLQAGLAFINIGPSLQGDGLAQKAVLGLASHVEPSDRISVQLGVSAEGEAGGVDRLHLGGEMTFLGKYAARLGYQADFEEDLLGGFHGFTAGAGYAWNDLQVDYAWVPFGTLGDSNRVSLSWHFSHAHETRSPSREAEVRAWMPHEIIPPPSPSSSAPVRTTTVPEEPKGMKAKVLSDEEAQALIQRQHHPQELSFSGNAQKDMLQYRQAIKENPQDKDAWRNLARIYDLFGATDQARDAWKAVLELDPSDPEALRWTASHTE